MANAKHSTPLKVLLLCLLFSFLTIFASPSHALNKITLAFSSDPEKSAQFKFFELLYREAFTRLDYEFHYQVLPMKRCSIMANRGKVDGEPQRYDDYATTYTNLIRVEEPVFVTNVFAFTTTPKITISSWDDFLDTHYYVDYVIGAVQTEQALVERVKPKYLTGLKSINQGLERLNAGRSDVFVDIEIRTKPYLAAHNLSSDILIAGTLSSHNSYPYLHKRHRDLAPKLAAVIRTIKAEGLYDKLLAQTLPFMSISNAAIR